MSPRKRGKRGVFRATKEVKRLARMQLGSPPPLQRQESRKRKPPKHTKRQADHEAE